MISKRARETELGRPCMKAAIVGGRASYCGRALGWPAAPPPDPSRYCNLAGFQFGHAIAKQANDRGGLSQTAGAGESAPVAPALPDREPSGRPNCHQRDEAWIEIETHFW